MSEVTAMKNIETLCKEQDQMLMAFQSLMAACQERMEIEAQMYNQRNDKAAFAELHATSIRALEKRTALRQAAYAMVKADPDLAGDLIERLLKRIMDEASAAPVEENHKESFDLWYKVADDAEYLGLDTSVADKAIRYIKDSDLLMQMLDSISSEAIAHAR